MNEINITQTVKADTDMQPEHGIPMEDIVPESYRSALAGRMCDLSDAIYCTVLQGKIDRDTIAKMKTWAREIVGTLDLFDTMLIYE